MGQVTRAELASLKGLLELEEALYAKFSHYAEVCAEEHVTKLCRQLADRSREHISALVAAVDDADATSDSTSM